MRSTPLVTIGIPSYGRGPFLREALQSALAQDYPQLEILVADDASPLDPWPSIADLADTRWSYTRHAENRGGPRNFNYLIERARGELFILHQDDDTLHPKFCRRAVAALQAEPKAVFYAGLMLRGATSQGALGFDLKFFQGPWTSADYLSAGPHLVASLDGLLMLLFSIPFMHPAIALRLEVLQKIGGYFEEFSFASDNITLSRMLLHGPALFDTRPSGFFRLHTSNTSQALPVARQYPCRRRQVELLLPAIQQQFPNWSERLTELLQGLPRRERWRVLVLSLEAGYPRGVQRAIARALGGSIEKSVLRARLFKANWRHQLAFRSMPNLAPHS